MTDDQKRAEAVEALAAKPWAELEALEFQDRVLFAGELKRRKADGSMHVVPIKLRVPRAGELRAARPIARDLAKNAKLDLDRDKDLVDSIENLVILHGAIRNTSEPYEPLYGDPLELERTWDADSLSAVWSRLEALRAMLDPAPADMTNEEVITVLTRIATEESLDPLAGYGRSTQARFILFTARLVLGLLASKSSSESGGSSTQAP